MYVIKIGICDCCFILFPAYSAFDSEAYRTPLPSLPEPPAAQRGSPTPKMKSIKFYVVLIFGM